jgi:NADH-quinone oxidoreductase subunit J
MDANTGLFYAFAAVLLFAAFKVITARNPVHAALYLVLAFFQASALWILLKAEFLAITLVLVYVGAVMVLFLFVVMMLDINLDGMRKGFWKHFPLAAGVGALIALQMAAVLMGGFRLSEPPRSVLAVGEVAVQLSNTKELGKLSAGSGRCHFVGRHDCRDCADAAPAQRLQVGQPGGSDSGQEHRPCSSRENDADHGCTRA